MAGPGARVALVVPTLDEEGAIGGALARVPSDLVGEVIVADGGSRDGTASAARAAGARVIEAGRGYGRACLAGATAAGHEVEIVAFMDGDGADDAGEIGRLIGPIRDGTHDFVIGSRARGKRESGAMNWHQLAAGWGAGFLIRMLYGTRYTDMCAFRAIRRDALMALDMREMTYGWNVEMQMKAARAGLRVLEVPVTCRRRIAGSSKVAGSLRGTLRAGTRIVATILRVAATAPASAATGAAR